MGVGSRLQRGGLKALVIDQPGEHLVASLQLNWTAPEKKCDLAMWHLEELTEGPVPTQNSGVKSTYGQILSAHTMEAGFSNFNIERLLLNQKTPGFLASGGEEFNPGPEMRMDRSELLCNKVLLKYKGDRESF